VHCSIQGTEYRTFLDPYLGFQQGLFVQVEIEKQKAKERQRENVF